MHASPTTTRTLQLQNRSASRKLIQEVEPIDSSKNRSVASDATRTTIPAASREQARRLYTGPTIRRARAWDSSHDSPGPHAYDERKLGQLKFQKTPSTCFPVAKRERDLIPARTPGPGDYNICHFSIAGLGNAIRFGDPTRRKRYLPRTPEHPIADVPCSYAEHVSCLHHQVTSDRMRSPTFYFARVPRFQVRPDFTVSIAFRDA